MNFHSYGNIWIHPFNYMHVPHKYPDNAYTEIVNFYETFKHEVAKVSKSQYGNAIETVEYATDGEASDWMLGEHKIVAFSPELGSFNPEAQTFFLPKDLIFKVINENYKVVDLFLRRNNFDMIDLKYGIDHKSEFTVSFRNKGLANLFNPIFRLSAKDNSFLQSITGVKVKDKDGDYTFIDLTGKQTEANILSFNIPEINRLDDFYLSLIVNDPIILEMPIDLQVDILMADEVKIHSFGIKFGEQTVSKFALLNMMVLMFIFAFTFLVLLFNKGYLMNRVFKMRVLMKD